MYAGFRQWIRGILGRAVYVVGTGNSHKHCGTYIALQDQVMHQVDDVGHCLFLPSLAARRMGELDCLAIAQ
jgi:hypothetical protein